GNLDSVEAESLVALVGALASRATRSAAAEALADLAGASGSGSLHSSLRDHSGALELLERLIDRVDHHLQPARRSILNKPPQPAPPPNKPAPSPPPDTQELA